MKLSLRIDPSKIPEFDDPMDNANIISDEGLLERRVVEDNYYLAMTTETMSDSITMTDDGHSV